MNSGDEIAKNEMGGECSTCGRKERFIQGCGGGNLRERDHLKDPGIDWRITLRWIFREWDIGDMDWIDLAQYRNRWRAFLNEVMNLRVP